MQGSYLIGFVSALLLAAVFVRLLLKPAAHLGLVDVPAKRKVHDVPTPKIGGLAMILALMVLAPFYFPSGRLQDLGVFVAAGIFFLIGLQSDRDEWPARWRYLAQLGFTITIALSSDLLIKQLGDLLGLGTIQLLLLAVPFTAFCVTCLVNGFNLLDGADGVLAMVSAPILLALAGCAQQSGASELATWLWLMLGALLGFAAYNLRLPGRARAVVFLGDAGSLMLGAFITFSVINLTQQPGAFLRPIDVVWIAGLPILDTVNVVWGRVVEGRSVFKPGKDHLHHRLLARGLGHGQVSAVMGALSAVLVFIGVVAAYAQWTEAWVGGVFVCLAACYRCALSGLSEQVGSTCVKSSAQRI